MNNLISAAIKVTENTHFRVPERTMQAGYQSNALPSVPCFRLTRICSRCASRPPAAVSPSSSLSVPDVGVIYQTLPFESALTSYNNLLSRLPDIFLVLYDPIRVNDWMCGFCNFLIAQQVMYHKRNFHWVCYSARVADEN